MQESITLFITVLVFSASAGSSIYLFVIGKFPGNFQGMKNYVVWGDRGVDPRLLLSKRARFVSSFLFIFSSLLILALVSQNNLFGNIIITNIISISSGIVSGILLCRKIIS